MDSLFCLSETLECSNPDFSSIRALSINNEPWFVGIDVAQVLGYSNTRDALNRHIDNDDRGGRESQPPPAFRKWSSSTNPSCTP